MAASYIQALIDGLLMGGVYALAALGVSLIFGVMKITNFAHGALITVGMYTAYEMSTALGVAPYVALPGVIVVLFVIGYLIQRLLVNPIINAQSHNQLLLTLGLSMVIENLILVIFTANYKQFTIPSFSASIPLGPLYINKPKLVAFLFVFVISVAIFMILNRTDMGRAIRATSVQKDGAALMGIHIRHINAVAFGIGVACAGIAGALIVPIQYIYPTSGENFQLKCFVIAVFGGLGNIWGAIAGGLIIGIIESLSALAFGGSWSSMVIYMIFILTLLLKPTGLFGKKA